MVPEGFLFNAVSCGIKGENRLDVGLIYCLKNATCAGVFTKNLVKAAPVIIGQEIVKRKVARAILVNSGCANACTGNKGLEDTRALLKAIAKELDISSEFILPASTGVIGTYLPLEKILAKIKELCRGLSYEKHELVAQAMMTTDTFIKVSMREVKFQEKSCKILGLAKGAGMIFPHMATMLAFILSDAVISPEDLQSILYQATKVSFNQISVDGDMSTNDTVYALSTGKSLFEVKKDLEEYKLFEKAFIEVCQELAYLIVKDGEGATKVVRVKVKGSKSEVEANMLAKSIANSILVKTAIFGEDPNWGRILAAMGSSGIYFDPHKVNIFIGPIKIVENGLGVGLDAEKMAREIMKKKEFTILIDLSQGKAQAEVITCDLSYEYIKINAEYRT